MVEDPEETVAGRLALVEARLSLFDARVEIEQLVRTYTHRCDPIDPAGIAALFTETATWASATIDGKTDFGHVNGRTAIQRHFEDLQEIIVPPTLHTMTQPELHIDLVAGTATGHWYSLVVTRPRHSREQSAAAPVLLGAMYEHEYRRVDGQWLFQALDTQIQFIEPLGIQAEAAVPS